MVTWCDESSRDVAERAAGVLAPESDLFEDLDSAGFGEALTHGAAVEPAPTRPSPARAAAAAGDRPRPDPHGGRHPVVRPRDRAAGAGRPQGPAVRRPGVEQRTRCSTASGWPTWRRAGAPGTWSAPRRSDDDVARKAEMRARPRCSTRWRRPTSCATNPAALKRAFDTGGREPASRARGTSSTTCATTSGRPRQVDTSGFEVGRNLAATPAQGRVPQRPHGAACSTSRRPSRCTPRPLLCSPPWINKYYVMDLAPGPQLHRVGRPARPHRLRHQLPEPDRGHVRHHDGRLPASTARRPRSTSSATSPAPRRSTSSGCAWAAR